MKYRMRVKDNERDTKLSIKCFRMIITVSCPALTQGKVGLAGLLERVYKARMFIDRKYVKSKP